MLLIDPKSAYQQTATKFVNDHQGIFIKINQLIQQAIEQEQFQITLKTKDFKAGNQYFNQIATVLNGYGYHATVQQYHKNDHIEHISLTIRWNHYDD